MKTTQKLRNLLLGASAAAMVIAAVPALGIDASAEMVYKTSDRTVAAGSGIKINKTNFPDSSFMKFVKKKADSNNDGSLSKQEISKTKKLSCSFKGIKNLKGIEYFTSLNTLDCSFNGLTSLDLSKNTALKKLDCNNCASLSRLNVSKNSSLTELDCYSCKLKSLDVSKNKALTHLDCGFNKLTSLDVSKNTALTYLGCNTENLKSLDISNNKALKDLDCGNNKLTKLDVSTNPALKSLSFGVNKLKKIDVSKNTALESAFISSNPLASIDLSKNPKVTLFDCSETDIKSLDLSKQKKMTDLTCKNCKKLESITTYAKQINFTGSEKLQTIDFKTTEKIGLVFDNYSDDYNPIDGCKSLKKIILNKDTGSKNYDANVKSLNKWLKDAKLKDVEIVKG